MPQSGFTTKWFNHMIQIMTVEVLKWNSMVTLDGQGKHRIILSPQKPQSNHQSSQQLKKLFQDLEPPKNSYCFLEIPGSDQKHPVSYHTGRVYCRFNGFVVSMVACCFNGCFNGWFQCFFVFHIEVVYCFNTVVACFFNTVVVVGRFML